MTDTIAPKISKNPTAKPAKKKPLFKSLFFQVLFGIFLGICFGVIAPEKAAAMKPLGDAFIHLIKMLIAPIIFCTIVSGMAGMGDVKQAGRVGAKAIIWFEIVTTIALVIGWIVVSAFEPGNGMHISANSGVDTSSIQSSMEGKQLKGTVDFLLDIIPHTMVSAFTDGNLLQVLLIAMLFSVALTKMGSRGKVVHDLIESFSHVLFKMVDMVTLLAPIGAFGAMSYTIGKFGIGALRDLGELVLLFYMTGFMFIVFIFDPVMRFYCKLSVWKLIRYIRSEIVIVLGTSSSETVLPRMMEKLTALGCSKKVVGLTIPAGYSFNLDGSSLYFIMGALFITFATDTPITFWQEASLLGVLLITSKGAAGVTGSAFLVLAATLASMNVVSQENLTLGLALLFAVDRFMSTGRAIINMIGNAVATIVVAKWENALDYKLARDILNKKVKPDLEVLER
ncbi:MAG: C4-dicarboxylate transporter DctA [Rickettsiales bacterium]